MERGDIVRKKTYYGYKYGKVLRKGYFTNHHWLIQYEDNVIEESEYILEVVMKGGGK